MVGALAALKAVRIRNKDILPALAIIAALLLLLFLSCGAMVALLLLPANGGQPLPGPAGPPPGATSNGTANGGEVPPINITGSLWDSITNQNVEIACLMAARDAAGSDAWAVQGCSCVETANATTKNYDCDIATLDPTTEYFARIECFSSSEICTVETNYGTQNISFDELAGMFG